MSWMTQGPPPGEDNVFSRYTDAPMPAWKRQAVGVGVALAALLVGTWVWMHSSEERSIAAMSPALRATHFQELREGFRQKCVAGQDAAGEARCHRQAERLLLFPECDEACRAEVAPVLRRTSR